MEWWLSRDSGHFRELLFVYLGGGCNVCHSICTERSEAIFPVFSSTTWISAIKLRSSGMAAVAVTRWTISPVLGGYSYWKFPFGKMEQSGRWVDPRQRGCIYLMELRVYNCSLLRPVMCVPHHSKRMLLPMVLMYLKLQKTRVATQGSPLVF